MKNKLYKFTRKEISLYSGLTIRQLEILRDKGVIIPQLTPIRYSWNQLILCAIFKCLREKFSWQDSAVYSQRYFNKHLKSTEQNKFTIFNHADVIVIQPGKGMVFHSSIDSNEWKDQGLVMEVLSNQPVERLLAIKKQADGSYTLQDEVQDLTVKIYVSAIVNRFYEIANAKNIADFRKKAELPPYGGKVA